MLICHATFEPAGAGFLVWAEDAGALAPTGEDKLATKRAPTKRVPTKRVPTTRAAGPSSHPFAATGARLAGALGDFAARSAGLAEALGDPEHRMVVLSLPTSGTGSRVRPVPSASAVLLAGAVMAFGAGAGARARATLRPWSVPVLALGPGETGELALALAQPPQPGSEPGNEPGSLLDAAGGLGPGSAGASLRWVAAVAELALDILARGRVLPVLEGTGTQAPSARWLPMPTAEDLARATNLAGRLPAVCRCALPQSGTNPSSLVAELLCDLVDASARQALAGHGLGPLRKGRKPAKLPAAEATLAALGGPPGAAQVLGGPDELAKLAVLLDEWRRPAAGPASLVRTCFRLTPPTDQRLDAADQAEQPNRPDRPDQPNRPDRPDQPSRARPATPARAAKVAVTARAAEAAEPTWSLEFLLQPASDPSLLVPASDVWSGGPALAALGPMPNDPREHLLADLGHASRLFPALDAALEAARPGSLDLDADGAYRFLSEGAPLLEQAGFAVLVPPWWHSARARLGLKLKAAPKKGDVTPNNGLGLAGLCDYHYEVALGDDTLTEAELRQLARLKAPLVRVKGRWVELRQEDLQAALDILDRQRAEPPGPMSTLDLFKVALGLQAAALPVVGIEATGWLGELLAGDSASYEAHATPAGFAGELRPYQQRGLGWMAWLDRFGLGACLADDMGLGKTAQLLGLLLAERESAAPAPGGPGRPTSTRPRRSKAAPGGLGPTLLACPMSVVGNWQREATRFSPSLSVHVHHGAARTTGKAFVKAATRADLVITTYSLLARDAELLSGVNWARLVLDEAQYVKNPDTRQAKAARSIPARRRVALTGTPVENHLSELWSIMDVLNPGLLGSREAFRKRFSVPIEREGNEDAARVLRSVTQPFVLRRLKTDRSIISDLPEKFEIKVFCNLTREQATLYQAVVDDMIARLVEAEGIQRKGIVLSTLTKLKQVCNHPAHLLGDGSRLSGRSGKLSQLEDIVDEVAGTGEKLLCFSQFSEMGEMLRGHLQARLGTPVPFLHGGVPKAKRDAMVEAFQAGEGGQVLVLSLKAGGVGLNLTAANHVVHFDRWWNPAVEQQATDRAFRIGQRRDVQVRKFICVGTVEERIDAMIERKRNLAERIVGSGEAWLAELSTEQIRELVALSADAVAEG